MRAALYLACSLLPASVAAQTLPCPDHDSRPPNSAVPLYRCAEVVLHPVNETMVDPLTYAQRLQAKWSRPSQDVWAPYDEASVLADFWRLWETGFLEDLWIEVIDEPYANGVAGRHVIFHLEERSRLKSVTYDPVGPDRSLKLEISKIEAALKERSLSLQLDAFVDQVSIGRAAAVIRDLYADEGFGEAVVVPERRALAGGPKLAAVSFRITPGPRWRIREVLFDGNHAFTDASLRRQLKDNRTRSRWLPFLGQDTFRDAKFPDDADRLREFYQNHGYPLAQIGAPRVERLEASDDEQTRWVRLRIPLDEGVRHRLGTVEVTGGNAVPQETLRRILDLNEGDPYSLTSIRKGIDRLREVYGALGFWQWSPDVDQQPRAAAGPDDSPVMDLTLGIDEGKRFFVNRIEFTGNTTTRDAVLRREMVMGEGGVFSTEALAVSLRRINQLGFLQPIERDSENVVITPTPGVDDRVNVTVKVEEQNKNQMAFGAGVSQLSGFFGQLSFQTANFIGRGETVSLSLQRGSLSNAYDLSLSSPYLFGRAITGGIQLFSRKSDYFLSNNILGYSEVRAGVSATTGFFVAPFTRLFITATREQVDTAVLDELKDADASVLAGTPLFNAALDEGRHQETRISPSLVYNTVDNPTRPRRGLRLTGSADVALPVLGGTMEYLRPEAEAIIYVPHTRRTALGVRAQMGWLFSRDAANRLPYYRRYFLGGEYQLRGTDLRTVGPLDADGRAIGGTRSLLFNLEYYLDVGPVRALAFHDAGQAFAEGEPLTFRRLRTSSGVEARFTMPMINVPIRVIYAWNFYRDNFQPDRTVKFGVGTTF